MAKVKQPLLSFDARRRLGDDIVFKRRGKTDIVASRPRPPDARSVGQLSWRHMFQKVVALWHALSAAEKEAWESLARPRHMTGYAWFLSQALRPNPGIYLPLQGGTMSGDINMDGNSIIELPAPSGAKHATRRSYVIARVAADILTHKGDAAAHHARYTDAEVDAILAIHTALAGAHHARYTDAEVDAILAVHSALATVHQDAPALIATHTAIAAAHHARYTDAEVDAILAVHSALATVHQDAPALIATHAAIAAAHHARYADAEAVTAAKTVKLDDFATPDDNADLNASITRHGLLKKLPNNAAQFLNGVGNWIAVATDAGEGHPVILSWDYSSIGQGVWAIAVNAAQALNYFFNNTSNNNGDNVSYKVFLAKGTYTMRVLYFAGPGSAIVDYYVAGVEKASIDGYAAGNTPNQVNTTAGIVIAASGLVDIKAQVDGRNPACVAWAASHTAIVFWRTA